MSLRYKTEKAVLSQQAILDYLLLRLKELEKEVLMYRRVVGGGLSKKGAVAAVEAEATLDLIGTLSVDHIEEKTAAHGVEIDGVTLKDGEATLSGTLLKFPRTRLNDWAWPNVKLSVSNLAGTQHGDFACGVLTSSGWVNSGNPGYLKAGNVANRYVVFWDGCGDVVGGWGKDPEEFWISKAGDIALQDQKMLTIGTYTDAQRPAAGTVGRIIFNTDDGMPNYDDGTNWRDINGNIT